MKKRILGIVIALFASLTLAACGGDLSTSDVVKSFEKAGLPVEDVEQLSDLIDNDLQDFMGFDSTDKKEMQESDAVHFVRPDSGTIQFNFIISHDDEEELKEVEAEMDDAAGDFGGIRTFTVVHKNILLHMTGAISEEEFREYEKALKNAK